MPDIAHKNYTVFKNATLIFGQ